MAVACSNVSKRATFSIAVFQFSSITASKTFDF